MATSAIAIDYSDLNRVLASVQGAVPVVERHMLGAITRSVAAVQHDAMAEVKVDTGTLRRSITTNVTPYLGRVGTNQPHGLTVEKGWPPFFAMPPQGSLLNWLARHGIPEEMEFVIRRNIYRRGFPANPFLEPALTRNQDGINKEFALAADAALREVYGR